MRGSERVHHRVEGRQLVGLCHGRPKPALPLVECELKEGAALALDGKRLVVCGS
jgi:hypothetical protein